MKKGTFELKLVGMRLSVGNDFSVNRGYWEQNLGLVYRTPKFFVTVDSHLIRPLKYKAENYLAVFSDETDRSWLSFNFQVLCKPDEEVLAKKLINEYANLALERYGKMVFQMKAELIRPGGSK